MNHSAIKKYKSKIAIHARNISALLLVFILALITAIIFVIINGINDNAAKNLVRAISTDSADRFSHYINRDIALTRKTAVSRAMTSWFTDEENESKKAAAFDEMLDYADLFQGVELYFGIHESLNEYSISSGTTLEDFVPFDKLDQERPGDIWYFECIYSENDYTLKVDPEIRSGIWYLWINHKVMSNGKIDGVFASGLEIPDIFSETFEGYGNDSLRGYIVNKNGVIWLYGGSEGINPQKDYRYINEEYTDPAFTSAFASYSNRITGIFDSRSHSEVIKLANEGPHGYAAIKPIADTDWSVVVFYRHSSLSALTEYLPLLIVLLSALFLYVVARDILMRRLIYSPLNRLTHSVLQAKSDEVDLFGKDRDDEIGDLARSIRRMWDSLNATNSDLLNSTLRQQRQEQRLHAINSAASVLLESAGEGNFLPSLQKGMAIIGRCLNVDRVQIWQNRTIDGDLHFVLEHEWLSEAGKKAVKIPKNLKFSYSARPEWKEKFLKGEYINGPLSAQSPEDQLFLNAYDIKSIVIVPLFIQYQFWGFFSVDDCRTERTFTDEELEIMRSGSLMLVNALNRSLQDEQLREAHDRSRVLLDSMPFTGNLWNRDAVIFDCNEEAVKLFNVKDKQYYIENFFLCSPEYQPGGELSADKGRMYVLKAFEEGRCVFDWMHQTIDGIPIPAEVTLVRVKFGDDYVVAGYARDLREYRQMMDEIERQTGEIALQSHWYKSILDATPLPISVTDANMNWTFVNKAVEDFLGTKLEDLLGKPCNNWNADICNTSDCGIACAKRGVKRTFFSNKGESYQVDVEILKDIHGEAAGFIEVVQDITKIKEMEGLALSASKAKSDFLATMSHEMRTPMNAILGIAEIQLQDETLSPKTREALDKIYNSGDLLLNIINDILDLSKIEAGKLELMPAEYQIASLINDTVTLNMMRIGSKPIEFVLSVDKNTPATLIGDELRIKQILNNVLSNAIKYTREGSVTFSVSAEMTPSEKDRVTLAISVSDTGQGMTEEQVSKLFDEYSRFNTEANRTTEGTGLGMSITRNLVRMMNGGISVKSEIGRGTVFTIRLPQKAVGDDVIGGELAGSLEKFQVNGMKQLKRSQVLFEPMPYGKVLIVDDVESNLYVAKGLMSPYELTIETVMSGFEAIDRIKDGGVFDVIFMDHMMPKMDGLEATKKIRDMGYTQPIVALTANAVVGQSDMFLANGFDGFISKPIDIRQLNAALKKFVRDRQPPQVIEAAHLQTQTHTKANAAQPSAIDPRLAEIFVRDARKSLATLEAILANGGGASFEEGDVRTFTINVHGIKSALANIGETELSAAAHRLEQAGRANDAAVMAAETPAFLSELRAMIEKLAPAQEDAENDEAAQDAQASAYLREKLLVVKEACEVFDKKAAKDAISELREKTWPRATREILGSISEHLLNGDFEEVIQAAQQIIGGIS